MEFDCRRGPRELAGGYLCTSRLWLHLAWSFRLWFESRAACGAHCAGQCLRSISKVAGVYRGVHQKSLPR
jgi:hypothetical protein